MAAAAAAAARHCRGQQRRSGTCARWCEHDPPAFAGPAHAVCSTRPQWHPGAGPQLAGRHHVRARSSGHLSQLPAAEVPGAKCVRRRAGWVACAPTRSAKDVQSVGHRGGVGKAGTSALAWAAFHAKQELPSQACNHKLHTVILPPLSQAAAPAPQGPARRFRLSGPPYALSKGPPTRPPWTWRRVRGQQIAGGPVPGRSLARRPNCPPLSAAAPAGPRPAEGRGAGAARRPAAQNQGDEDGLVVGWPGCGLLQGDALFHNARLPANLTPWPYDPCKPSPIRPLPPASRPPSSSCRRS